MLIQQTEKGKNIVNTNHLNTNMYLFFFFQVLLPPYEEAIAIPPKDPPPQYVSAWELPRFFNTTLLQQTLSKETISCHEAHCVAPVCRLFQCDVSLFPLLRRQRFDFEMPFPSLPFDKAAQLSWQTQRCASAPISIALSAIMCGTGLFNTVNLSVVLPSTDIPEIWMRRAW